MTTTTAITPSISTSVKPKHRVVIQGCAGAFHEIAARLYFQEDNLQIVRANTFTELVQKVEKQHEATTGIMAIENSLAGTIMYNYHLLQAAKLLISGELFLRIRQNLMTLPGTRLEDLTEVRSHPMAIAQCREFFLPHPHIRLVEYPDTALSAREIHENQLKGIGAIASTMAAELYGLEIIAPGIETNKKNYTRFLVLEPQTRAELAEDANKVSLCFAVRHAVGSLHQVLAVLAAYDLNLTKIQSTPIPGRPWDYMFFVDFTLGGRFGWQAAVDAVSPLVSDLQILGAYQQGVHVGY